MDEIESITKKPKQVFNSIEEYETFLNDNMKDSLSIFLNIFKDIDFFKKMVTLEDITKNGEVNISPPLEALFKEIKQNDIVLLKIKNNLREINENKISAKKERKRVHYYFCKENGTNLAVTKFLNPFNQRELPSSIAKPRYFFRDTEVGIINDLICKKMKKVIHQKFDIAFEEGIENERWTKDGTKIDKEEEDNVDKLYNTKIRRKIANNVVKRLYPKPLDKENINDQFFIDKINEFHYNGNYLIKKVNFPLLFKEFKIQPKEDYKGNLVDDVKLTDNIIKDYQEEKNIKEKSSIKNISKKSEIEFFQRGDLYFDKNNFLITKSKMYIKVDRKEKEKDFKIRGGPLDNNSLFFD